MATDVPGCGNGIKFEPSNKLSATPMPFWGELVQKWIFKTLKKFLKGSRTIGVSATAGAALKGDDAW